MKRQAKGIAVLMEQAMSALRAQNWTDAGSLAGRAKLIAEADGDREAVVRAELLEAQVKTSSGGWNKKSNPAEVLDHVAAEVSAMGNPRLLAQVWGTLGSALRSDTNRCVEALEALGRAEFLYNELGDHQGAVTTALDQANVLEYLLYWDEALLKYRDAIKASEAALDAPMLGVATRYLSMLHARMSDWRLAADSCERALKIEVDASGASPEALGLLAQVVGYVHRSGDRDEELKRLEGVANGLMGLDFRVFPKIVELAGQRAIAHQQELERFRLWLPTGWTELDRMHAIVSDDPEASTELIREVTRALENSDVLTQSAAARLHRVCGHLWTTRRLGTSSINRHRGLRHYRRAAQLYGAVGDLERLKMTNAYIGKTLVDVNCRQNASAIVDLISPAVESRAKDRFWAEMSDHMASAESFLDLRTSIERSLPRHRAALDWFVGNYDERGVALCALNFCSSVEAILHQGVPSLAIDSLSEQIEQYGTAALGGLSDGTDRVVVRRRFTELLLEIGRVSGVRRPQWPGTVDDKDLSSLTKAKLAMAASQWPEAVGHFVEGLKRVDYEWAGAYSANGGWRQARNGLRTARGACIPLVLCGQAQTAIDWLNTWSDRDNHAAMPRALPSSLEAKRKTLLKGSLAEVAALGLSDLTTTATDMTLARSILKASRGHDVARVYPEERHCFRLYVCSSSFGTAAILTDLSGAGEQVVSAAADPNLTEGRLHALLQMDEQQLIDLHETERAADVERLLTALEEPLGLLLTRAVDRSSIAFDADFEIVPFGLIEGFPLDVFQSTARNGVALGDYQVVRYGVSASMLDEAWDVAAAFAEFDLQFVSLGPTDRLDPEFAVDELEHAARVWGQPATDGQAAIIFHFSGHAVFDDLEPSLSRLEAAGGTIDLGGLIERENWQKTRLAVLSACQSGVSGEHGVGLASVVVGSGVPGAIATLWPVNDAATTILVARFHLELRAHHANKKLRRAGPAKSLAAAKSWMSAADHSELVRFCREQGLDHLGSRLEEDAPGADFRGRSFWGAFRYFGA